MGILSEFHKFVRPTETPEISKFYHTKHQFTATDNVTCFVTWTDWDIGNQLIHELKRKKIGHPVALKSWIDLRSIARRQLPVTKYKHVPRLRKMFEIYDIEWEGN